MAVEARSVTQQWTGGDSNGGGPPATEPGSRVSQRLSRVMAAVWQNRKREWWPRLVLLLAAVLILGSLFVMLFPGLPLTAADRAAERHLPALDNHFRLLILTACVLPPILSWLAYLLINKRAIYQTVRPSFLPGVDETLEEAALASWTYEIGKAQWSLSRAEVFAGMWGIMTTASIVGAVSLLIPPFHTPGTIFDGPRATVAFAVIGAAVTSFLLDLSRVCIRAANDDATKRMFAEALRSLILSVITTLALVLLAALEQPGWLSWESAAADKAGAKAVLIALGIGAGVAVMGSSAFEWMQARVSKLFGAARKVVATGTPLEALGGMGEAEALRLAEEGIECVEALVNTPIPRIFLNTRFSLRRIAEWYDMGLLIARVGREAATELHGRWGIRGAVEISRTVTNTADPAARETLRKLFQKSLRVDGDAEADLVLHYIACDERVALTETFRQTHVCEEDQHPELPQAASKPTPPRAQAESRAGRS